MTDVEQPMATNGTFPIKKRPSLARQASKGVAKMASSAAAPMATVARTLSGFLNKKAAAEAKQGSTKGLLTDESPQRQAVEHNGNDTTPITPLTPFTPEEQGRVSPSATDSLVGEAVKVLDEMALGAEAAASPAKSEQGKPVEAPALIEVGILKHGVPWRGSYQRRLVVGSGKVITLDPETREETNSWESPRDVPKALARPTEGIIELSVAPWPEAPAFLHQKVTTDATKRSRSSRPPPQQRGATLSYAALSAFARSSLPLPHPTMLCSTPRPGFPPIGEDALVLTACMHALRIPLFFPSRAQFKFSGNYDQSLTALASAGVQIETC